MSVHKEAEFESVLARVTSPEYDQMLQQHQRVIQNGYSNVLKDLLHQDSLSGIISLLRLQLFRTFSLSHTVLVKVIPIPKQEIGTPIFLNYKNGYMVIEWGQDKIFRYVPNNFPMDPWSKALK